MPATVYGDINFGLSAETGLYVASVEHEATMEEKWIKDEQGFDVAGALYNPSGTFTMSGVLNTGEVLSAVVGATLTLANAIDWADLIGNGYTTGGTTYITSHKQSLKQDDAEMRDISGGFKPFVVVV